MYGDLSFSFFPWTYAKCLTHSSTMLKDGNKAGAETCLSEGSEEETVE